MKRVVFLLVIVGFVAWLPYIPDGHCSGRPWWHSWPSDRGTYVYGDTGHCTDKQYTSPGNQEVWDSRRWLTSGSLPNSAREPRWYGPLGPVGRSVGSLPGSMSSTPPIELPPRPPALGGISSPHPKAASVVVVKTWPAMPVVASRLPN
jgi:hypothetical protein